MKRMHGWKKMPLLVAAVGMILLCLGAPLVQFSPLKEQEIVQQDGDPRVFYMQPEEEDQRDPRTMPFAPDLSKGFYSWELPDPTQELPVVPVE